MIRIIAVLCKLASPDVCHEQMITNSDYADLTMAACMVGEPQIVKWLTEEHPQYRLAGWRCEIGNRAKRGA